MWEVHVSQRTALVTGANRGLGRAVAERLGALGIRVVVSARDGSAAAVAAGLGGRARAVTLDVTSDASVAAAAAEVGEVDILVNNAGVLLDGGYDPLSVPPELVQRTLAVNLLGTWRVTQAFLPGMVKRGWGRVVILSSGTSTFRNGLFAGAPAYSVSKLALNGLTTMLAAQVRDSGVLVNAVNPGMVRTRMMPRATVEPAEAAAGVVAAAMLPDDGPHGRLLRSGTPVEW
jgi:NAD(P)-dependent dehydrogenase (short-subunit alcohol dehydrogenase family)